MKIKVYEKIENGVVYNIEEGENHRVKSKKCMEYSLNCSLSISVQDKHVLITGCVYKENYKEEPTPIEGTIKLIIDNEEISELQSEDGLVSVDLTINDIEKHSLIFKENSRTFGNFEFGGVESE